MQPQDRVRKLLPRLLAAAFLVGGLCATAAEPGKADGSLKFESGHLPRTWFSGGPECSRNTDDFQTIRYNDNFHILRESGCVHSEKPYLYLLFGKEKAILFDTGAGNDTDATTGRLPDVAGAVDRVMSEWLKRNRRKSIPLVVTHLHSHWDHIWGDEQFRQRENTTLVKPGDVAALKSLFGIRNWPHEVGTFDLGGRVLDIVPIPGHDATSIAVYDRNTAILLTGDTVYPGRIYINEPDPAEFQASIQRLVDFTSTRPVAHVLGTHIEQRGPYQDYPLGQHYAPEEIRLELGRGDLLELLEAAKLRTESKGKTTITQRAYRSFTICGTYPNCEPVNRAARH